MAHITVYQLYYPMLLDRTKATFKGSKSTKRLGGKLDYMSNKFYQFMLVFMLYFFYVGAMLLPSITNLPIFYVTQFLTVIISLYFFYMQKYVLMSYEKAIIHANKNLKKY